MNYTQTRLVKEVKQKNKISNMIIAAHVIFSTLPLLVIVAMVTEMIQKSLTIDHIIQGGIAITICLILKSLCYSLSIWTAHKAAYGVLTDIRVNITNHLKRMSLGFFAQKKSGDLANIINHDVEQVELYLAHALPEIVSATLIPTAILIVILIIDWRLGLALVSTVPLALLLQKLVKGLWADRFKKYGESTKKMSEDLLEYIATIPVIKAFGREEGKTGQILSHMRDYILWVKKTMLSVAFPMGFISMLLEGGLIAMIIVGSVLLQDNIIKVQQFALAIMLGGIFTTSFAKLATFQHYGVIFNQSMSRIGSVLNIIPPSKSNIHDTVQPGDIVIRDLDFSYNRGEKTLSNLNLTFSHNKVHAIVGSSGSGKSTLAHLMMGFWQPQKGSISIGGKDIADMTEEALSKLVSIVQQDVFLFNLSIEENIRMGKTDATKEEIIDAARRAQIHDFIMTLPQGYDTPVGEGGVKFSGGEKQRISIARMMLKNTPIVILDEATAAIDPNNEQLIQKAITNLGQDKTLITVAHHLHTIIHADQIVVMESGMVIATGTHDELSKNCNEYICMVEQQDKVDNWHIKEYTL